MQGEEAVTLNLTHKKLRHLISEKGRGLAEPGACDITRVLPEWIRLQPDLGGVGGSEMDEQKGRPASELCHLLALTRS